MENERKLYLKEDDINSSITKYINEITQNSDKREMYKNIFKIQHYIQKNISLYYAKLKIILARISNNKLYFKEDYANSISKSFFCCFFLIINKYNKRKKTKYKNIFTDLFHYCLYFSKNSTEFCQNFSLNTLILISAEIEKIIAENKPFDDEIFIVLGLVMQSFSTYKYKVSEMLIENLIDGLDKIINQRIKNYLFKTTWFLNLLLLDFDEEKTRKKIFDFLISIYLYRLPSNFYTKILYKKTFQNVSGIINSIYFLDEMFQKEEELRNSKSFFLKSGFIIKDGNYLVLHSFNFSQTKDYTFIFSFMPFNESDNYSEDIPLFTLKRQRDQKGQRYFQIFIQKQTGELSLSLKNKVVKTKFRIKNKKSYLICFYNESNVLSENVQIFFQKEDNRISSFRQKFTMHFEEDMKIEFGGNTFNGAFGEVIGFKKTFKKDENFTHHLFNLCEDYSSIIQSSFSKSLIKRYQSHFIKRDNPYLEAIKYFNNLKLKPDLFISTSKIHKYLSHPSCISIKPSARLFYFNQLATLDIYKIDFTLSEFLANNGTNFLIFALHQTNNNKNFTPESLSNNQKNELLNSLFRIVHTLADTLGIQYFNEEKPNPLICFFGTVAQYIKFNCDPESNNSSNRLKLNNNVIRSLINLLIFFNLNNDEDCSIRNTLINIMFIKDYIEPKVFKLNIADLLTSLTTCIKTSSYDLINKEMLYKILSFDCLIDQKKTSCKKIYKELLYKFLVDNEEEQKTREEITSYFFQYYTIYSKDFSEYKKYFYTKFIFLFLSDESKIPCIFNLNSKYFDNLRKNIIRISPSHCKYCDLMQSIFYLIIKQGVEKCKGKKLEGGFEREIDVLYNELFFISCPNFVFLKSSFSLIFGKSFDNRRRFKFIKSEYAKNKEEGEKINFDQCFDSSVFPLGSQTDENLNYFKKHFKHFIKYIIEDFKKFNQQKKEIPFERLFNMILEFIYFISNKTKQGNEKFLNSLLNLKYTKKFFVFLIKTDELKGLNSIIKTVKLTISKVQKAFYFKILEEEEIKIEIRAKIIDKLAPALISMKNKIPNLNNFERENIDKNNINLLKTLYLIIVKQVTDPEKLNFSSCIGFIEYLIDKEVIFSKLLYNFENEQILPGKCILEIIFDIFSSYLFKLKNPKYLVLIKNLILPFSQKSTILPLIDTQKSNNKSGVQAPFCFTYYFFCIIMSLSLKLKKDNYSLIGEKNYEMVSELGESILKDIKDNSKELKKIKCNNFNAYNYTKVAEFINRSISYDLKYSTCLKFYENCVYSSDKEIIQRNLPNELISSLPMPQRRNLYITQTPNKTVENQNEKNIRSKSQENIVDKNLHNNYSFKKIIIYIKKKSLREVLNDKPEPSTQKKKEKEKVEIGNIYDLLVENKLKHETELLFNPKNYFLWTHFAFSLKDQIFYDKNFHRAEILYKKKYLQLSENSKKEEELKLPYPTKLANFICNDYYRPFYKRDIKFFHNNLINVSHPYIKNFDFSNELNNITFEKLIPTLEKDNKKLFYSELIKNKGYIFGDLEINNFFILFSDKSTSDFRFLSSTPSELKMDFLYSSDDGDKLVGMNKYVLIYLSDIEEIVQRRFCFQWIGFEIFLKNKKSFLFNLFTKEKFQEFIDTLNKIKAEKGYSFKYHIDFKKFFSNEYRRLYKLGKIENFKYLCLMNKYSGRSYNDLSQYPVIPWIINNIPSQPRDLSCSVCQQKKKIRNENGEYVLSEKAKRQYEENIKTNNCHFSIHYSNSGYIFHYLSRVNPITFNAIKFQSNQFDQPERLFFSIKGLLHAFEITEDNRELIPEFFSDYHFMLNLNYNSFGFCSEKNFYVHNVICEGNESSIEYTASQKQLFEKIDNFNLWIDNIFGVNQLNYKTINIFPLYTYAQFNDYEKEILRLREENKTDEEIISSIRNQISLFYLGITPHKLFKHAHPKRGIDTEKNIREISFDELSRFIKEKKNESCSMIKNGDEIYLRFKKSLSIFEISYKEKKILYKKTIKIKKQIALYPEHSSFCSFSKSSFFFCRFSDNTIKLYVDKDYQKSFQWNCLVTSIEAGKQIKSSKKEIIIGDSKGFISKIYFSEIENNTSVLKKVQCHESSVNGLLYSEKLNLIISNDSEGIISLRDYEKLSLINIIEPHYNSEIYDIKLSKYDFLYIVYENRIICYTLNGLLVSDYISPGSIKGFEILDAVGQVLIGEDKVINAYQCYNLKKNPIERRLKSILRSFISIKNSIFVVYQDNNSMLFN